MHFVFQFAGFSINMLVNMLEDTIVDYLLLSICLYSVVAKSSELEMGIAE